MIHKSLQYCIYCENWPQLCDEYTNYTELETTPAKHFRSLGYRKINGKWYCKECAKKLKEQPLNSNKSVTL